MSNSKPRRRIIGCLVFTVGLALLVLFAQQCISTRVAGKAQAPHKQQRALEKALRRVAPEAQMESDTCGLHTLRVIYQSYGINPDTENLRIRLGLDVVSNPLDAESTGTLQYDMLRVLVQDNFDYELLNFSHSNLAERLTTHLNTTNMAAIPIRRRPNGYLHWVAARSGPTNTITILDSLSADAYLEKVDTFLQDSVLSCIMVSPRGAVPPDEDAIERAHQAGAKDMIQTVWRYRQLDKSAKSGANRRVE